MRIDAVKVRTITVYSTQDQSSPDVALIPEQNTHSSTFTCLCRKCTVSCTLIQSEERTWRAFVWAYGWRWPHVAACLWRGSAAPGWRRLSEWSSLCLQLFLLHNSWTTTTQAHSRLSVRSITWSLKKTLQIRYFVNITLLTLQLTKCWGRCSGSWSSSCLPLPCPQWLWCQLRGRRHPSQGNTKHDLDAVNQHSVMLLALLLFRKVKQYFF